MVDEDDASYKEEQTPMYETRQVLLRRADIFGFDVAFVGVCPSVELMALAGSGKVAAPAPAAEGGFKATLIDLANYKSVPFLVSPPVRDALEVSLKVGGKSILVLNRKGSYRLTRCVDCGEILKCANCDSPLYFSRAAGRFLCRHCTYTAPGETTCPNCQKPSWRSYGIGVEQLHSELKKYFPQAKIVFFEREARAKKSGSSGLLPDFDILISTQAVLRFQGTLRVRLVAFIDFDAELNRVDARSAFNAFRLALHVGSMASQAVLLQTRNPGHYVLQCLSQGRIRDFYDEELKLRKEFGFSPFKHWINVGWRGKSEKSTYEAALHVYNILSQPTSEGFSVTPPLADAVGRKRGQFRFNVMVQADDVPPAVALVRSALAQTKRGSRLITTLNVDP